MSATHRAWNFEAAGFVAGGCVATLLLFAGCQSPQVAKAPAPPASAAAPSPAAPDVRTEANIIQMENQYIADKNSQPTHQHEAEAKKQKKEEDTKRQAEQERAAQEAKNAEAAPVKPQG